MEVLGNKYGGVAHPIKHVFWEKGNGPVTHSSVGRVQASPRTPSSNSIRRSLTTLQWVASHSFDNEVKKDPWLLNHGNFDLIFIGGDSAGGNLVHNIALQAGAQGLKGRVKISGGFLSHPHFLCSGAEDAKSLPTLIWEFVYLSAPGGPGNALINPFGPGKSSLTGLGCSKLLVCVAEKDELRDIRIMYYNAMKESGWKGEIEVYETMGENHAFHVLNFGTQNSRTIIKRLATFLN
ncbi:hypothetical protein V6N13_017576 [Hibiscus sabdariffa]|uniref:Uncharacterized protein n=2 Tax=Hibiscus sabdariffa TaxID=183260 RepID=A0ABR2CI40_9ROSI